MSPAPEPAAYRENRLDPVSAHPPKPSQVLQGGTINGTSKLFGGDVVLG